MAGKTGGRSVTIKKIKILKVDLHQFFILLKGSVPGNKNSYLMIKKRKWN